MRLFSAAIAVAVVSSFGARAQEGGSKPKVVVLPFAAFGKDVQAKVGSKVAGMLTTELKNGEQVELVELKRADAAGAAASDLQAQAKQLVDDAKALRAKKKFRLADEALQKALALYRTDAAQVGDVGDVIDATALLSAVQFNTGRDDEGLKSLTAALVLAPDRELPLAQTSPLFAKVVNDARAAVRAAPKNALVVESFPPGGAVMVDGVAVGTAPVLVREVPVGAHFYKVQLPSGEVVGGVAEVSAVKSTTVRATSQSKSPDAKLLSALSQNRLDAEAMVAAKEAAAASGADAIVFGVLTPSQRATKGFALDAFSLSTTSGELKRLPQASLDTELLSAGMEIFGLASEIGKQGGLSTKAPLASIVQGVSTSSQQTEVRYGQSANRDLAAEALEGEAASPKPAEQRRVPLKKK